MTMAALLEELRDADREAFDYITTIQWGLGYTTDNPIIQAIIQGEIQRACERRGWAHTLEYVSWYAPTRRWHAYISTGPRGCDTKDTAADSAAEALLMAYIAAVREEAK